MDKGKDKKGKTLQQLISARGYKIQEFCKDAGIPKSTLYAYLSGNVEPSAENVISIAKTLKCSLKEAMSMLGKDVSGVPDDE